MNGAQLPRYQSVRIKGAAKKTDAGGRPACETKAPRLTFGCWSSPCASCLLDPVHCCPMLVPRTATAALCADEHASGSRRLPVVRALLSAMTQEDQESV